MRAIYNEIDAYAASWLRNLIGAGHVAHGDVDERSIAELSADDVAGSGQRHFFAGIGGWSHALRLAGWPDDVDVWTGSCPCQPFSAAGRGRGFADERHLWPAWFRLIAECRPSVVFGEQVASPDALIWLDAVRADMEGAGYAVGVADLCAAGVGAPHIRQRLYWVAIAGGERCEGVRLQLRERRPRPAVPEAVRRGADGVVGDSNMHTSWRFAGAIPRAKEGGEVRRVSDRSRASGSRMGAVNLGDADRPGLERPGERCDDGAQLEAAQRASGATRGHWSGCEWIPCRDGKSRPVEPGAFPLAHGVSGRVGRLRAYGNAIVPQAAAVFVGAVIDYLRK